MHDKWLVFSNFSNFSIFSNFSNFSNDSLTFQQFQQIGSFAEIAELSKGFCWNVNQSLMKRGRRNSMRMLMDKFTDFGSGCIKSETWLPKTFKSSNLSENRGRKLCQIQLGPKRFIPFTGKFTVDVVSRKTFGVDTKTRYTGLGCRIKFVYTDMLSFSIFTATCSIVDDIDRHFTR